MHTNIEKYLILGILGIVALFVPHILSSGIYFLTFEEALAWIPIALGLYLLYSHTGQVAFGQSAFFAMGAYVVGWLSSFERLIPAIPHITSVLVTIPLSILAAAGLAALLGLVIVKRRGIYFGVMSVASAMVVWSVVFKLDSYTGGSDGVAGLGASLLGHKLGDLGTYYLILIVVVILAFVMWRIINSPFGVQLRSIRGDKMKSEALGIPSYRMLWFAFIIAGAFGGASGALQGILFGYAGPEFAHFLFSSELLFAAVIGGFSYFAGAIVGPFVFLYLNVPFATRLPELGALVHGLLIAIIILTTGSEGLWGMFKKAGGLIDEKFSISEKTKPYIREVLGISES